MKLLTILPFVYFALAYDIIRAGIMFISKVDGTPTRLNLISGNQKLLISSEGSRFDFHKLGLLKLTGTNQYLKVDDNGRFVFLEEQHEGFELSAEGKSKGGKKRLSYKGRSIFDLCEDDLVGTALNCPKVRKVLITYEDINQSYQDNWS